MTAPTILDASKEFSISQINSYLLAKHHLMRRDGKDICTVADDLLGLHATSNVTPYISLFNRIEKFSTEDLTRTIYDQEGLVRIRAMRGTFFLVTQSLLSTMTEATQFPKDRINKSLANAAISLAEFQTVSKLILDSVSERPKSLPEIKRELSSAHARTLDWKRGHRITRRTNLGVVLHVLLLQRRVQSLPEKIVWRSINWDGYGTRTFTRIKKVTYALGSTQISDSIGLEEAKTKLAQLYVKRYGPVTIEDIAWWMDEPKLGVLRFLNRLSDKVAKIWITGSPGDFLLCNDDVERLEKAGVNDVEVRFLPYEDPYAKGWKVKARIIPRTMEKRVYPFGNALPTVTVDGRITATWSVVAVEKTAKLNVTRVVPTDRKMDASIVEEGQRLGEFLMGERPITVVLRGP